LDPTTHLNAPFDSRFLDPALETSYTSMNSNTPINSNNSADREFFKAVFNFSNMGNERLISFNIGIL